jgi:hypothetical protein
MTTDVLRVSGDYIVKAPYGSVTFDTPSTVVNGNFTVVGTSTSVESVNATIKDNILILNSGEPLPGGVTLGSSGIMISRDASNTPTLGAFFIYNERQITDGVTTGTGIWTFGNPINYNYNGAAIAVEAIRSPFGNVNFLGVENPLGVLNVRGTTDYETQVSVFGDDAIPNKKYVDDALSVGTDVAKKIQVGNSFVQINSPNVLISDPYYNPVDRIYAALSTNTNVVFKLEGGDASIQGLTINKGAASITVNNTNTNLTLNPGGTSNSTGTLVVNAAMRIVQTQPISTQTGYTSIYTTSTVGGGGTGLYYVNTAGKDELVSRRRSIIYGIIF